MAESLTKSGAGLGLARSDQQRVAWQRPSPSLAVWCSLDRERKGQVIRNRLLVIVVVIFGHHRHCRPRRNLARPAIIGESLFAVVVTPWTCETRAASTGTIQR